MVNVIGWLLAAAGALAAWLARGKQMQAETEKNLLREAIQEARRKNREVRIARHKARKKFDMSGLDDNYKFIRRNDDV